MAAKTRRLDRLTCRELAAELRVSPATVRLWQQQGIPYIPCGRLRFYHLADVEAWLRKLDAAKQKAKKAQQQQPVAA